MNDRPRRQRRCSLVAASGAPMGCPRAVAPPCTFALHKALACIQKAAMHLAMSTLSLSCKVSRPGTQASCLMMPPLRPCMKCPKAFAPLCRSALHFSLEMSLLEAVQLISGPGLLPTSMMCISHRFRVTEKLHCTGSFQGFYQVPQEPVKVCRDWLTIIETAPCDSKLSHGCMQCCFCFM